MSHTRSIILRRAAGLMVLCLTMLLAGTMWYLASPNGERMIRSFVIERLGPRLGIDLAVGSLETNVFTRLVLDQVTVALPGSDRPPLAQLTRAEIRYSLLDLLALRLTVSDVTIDSLIVRVTRDSTGTLSLPERNGAIGEDTDSGGSGPLSLWFGTLTLNDGAVRYDDHSLPLRARIDGLSVTLAHQPVEGYRITADADSGFADIRGIPVPIDDVSVNARIRGDTVDIHHLILAAATLNVAGSGTVSLDRSPPGISAEVTITGDTAALTDLAGDRLPERFRDMDGPVDAMVRVAYDAVGFTVGYDVDVAPFRIGTLPFTGISLDGSIGRQAVVIDSLVVTTPAGGKARLAGLVGLDSLLTHEGTITFDGFRAERFWRFVRGKDGPYRGSIGGTLATTGPLREYLNCHAELDAAVNDVTFEGERFGDIDFDAGWRDGQMEFALIQDGTSISGTASLEDSLAGSFTARIANARFLNGMLGVHTVSGTALLDGELSGQVSHPSLDLSFHAEDAYYRGLPIDRLDGSLSYRPGSFILDETGISGYVSDVSGLTFPPLPEGFAGSVTYEGTVSFLDGSLAADARFEVGNPAYREFSFDRGAAVVSLRDTQVTIASFELDGDDGMSIAAAGEYHIDRKQLSTQLTVADSTGQAGSVMMVFDHADSTRQTGDAMITGVSLARISTLTDSLPTLAGLANGRVRFELSPGGPAFSVAAAVDSLVVNNIPIGHVWGAGVLAYGTARIDSLIVAASGNRIMAQGMLAYGEWPEEGIRELADARTEGRIVASDFTLGSLGGYLPTDMRLDGAASAEISWDGTLADPWLNGYVRIEDGSLQAAADSPPVEGIGVDLRFNRSRLTIEQLTATSLDLTVQAWGMFMAHTLDDFEGAVTLAVNGEDSFSAAGRYRQGRLTGNAAGVDFNLAAMQGFVPMLRNLEGTMQAHLAVNGSPAIADLSGAVSVSSLAFTPPALRERFTNGTLRVSFDAAQVSLDTLTAQFGGGTIEGTGDMVVEGSTPRELTLTLTGRDMNFRENNAYDIRVNDVSITGAVTGGRIVLEGDLMLGETRITRTIRTRDIIAMTRARPQRPGKPNPLLDSAQLSIRLHDSDAVWIDNNLVKVRMQPELTIAGSPRAPVITGRLSADEGSLFYLDRKFELQRLFLDFIDPDRTNPLLDIQAETSVRSAQAPGDDPFVVTLTISGTADSPRVELASNPALDQTDILSLLTFGATTSQLGASTGQTDILRSRAELLSSQQLSNYLSREARSILGLDDLSIQGNLFNTGKASGPQLLASDTITDRLRVTYTTTVGEQNEQSIRLDYRLSRFFSLEGQTNQDGDAGLDLKYRFKF